MKLALAGAIAFVLSAPVSPAEPPLVALAEQGTANSGMPPQHFRANSVSIVVFTDNQGIAENCGVAPPGYRVIACKRSLEDGTPVIIMPNPCFLGEVEYYAKIQCHENAHVNGWGPNHED